MCGFMNSNLVTEPVSVIGLSLSNSTENPWCASAGHGVAIQANAASASVRASDDKVLKIAPQRTKVDASSCITEGFAGSSGNDFPQLGEFENFALECRDTTVNVRSGWRPTRSSLLPIPPKFRRQSFPTSLGRGTNGPLLR